MASAITLEGIDQTISNLEYKNKNTLKYRFVQHIRQYYTSESSVVSLNEIDHEALIKMLWDTDHSLEAIKNKRKNLNGVRSSVNADFKKLYERGENPGGIKIGSSNIFVMSEDAKDKILKKVGYDFQPDGTLKLDQIMDILKLASETVTGSMAVENKEKKGGLKKIDRLKDLIKGLSEKVGLGSPEWSNAAPEVGDMAAKGDEQGSGSMGMAGVLDEEPLDEVDEVAEIADPDDEVEYIEGGAEEEILDDVEEVEIDEISDTDTDDLVEADEVDEEVEDVLDEEDTELDYVEDVVDVEGMLGGETSEEPAGESGPGDDGTLEGVGLGQDSGQEKTGIDIGGDEALSKDDETGLEAGDKEDGEGVGHGMAGRAEHRFEEGEEQNGNEQLGLPVGSLGQECSIEADSNIKKDKLLAEEFDGYLGSMDRHYNHYILIPDGEYIIGSKNPKKDEKSEQVVSLEPFYFGRFPVTNGLFEIFIEKTGYKTTAEKVGYGTVYHGRFERKKDETTGLITSTWNSSLYCETIEGACWYQPSGPKSTLYNKRNHPVVQISMEDAMAFAAWTGKRLPTENEWEAASRTANGWIFSWGPKWKKDACNIEDSCTADTTAVDKYVEFENDFGIVDTIGNVLEWTNDSFGSTSRNNNGAKYRAVRGGSWISGNDIRLFSRVLMEPESHSNILGFRCVAY
jgi:formylglycine-generating enzyme required for sulfatase activity